MKGLFQCPRGTEGVVKTIEEGLGEKVESSLAKEGRGDSKNLIRATTSAERYCNEEQI